MSSLPSRRENPMDKMRRLDTERHATTDPVRQEARDQEADRRLQIEALLDAGQLVAQKAMDKGIPTNIDITTSPPQVRRASILGGLIKGPRMVSFPEQLIATGWVIINYDKSGTPFGSVSNDKSIGRGIMLQTDGQIVAFKSALKPQDGRGNIIETCSLRVPVNPSAGFTGDGMGGLSAVRLDTNRPLPQVIETGRVFENDEILFGLEALAESLNRFAVTHDLDQP